MERMPCLTRRQLSNVTNHPEPTTEPCNCRNMFPESIIKLKTFLRFNLIWQIGHLRFWSLKPISPFLPRHISTSNFYFLQLTLFQENISTNELIEAVSALLIKILVTGTIDPSMQVLD